VAPLPLGEWLAVKLAGGELTERLMPLTAPWQLDRAEVMFRRPTRQDAACRDTTTGGVNANAAHSALGRHTAATLCSCELTASSGTVRCGLALRHPYLAPLALELAAAADAVDAQDESLGASAGWPPFRPPHVGPDVAWHLLDATLGCAALWRVLDGAGVDLGVLSGQPFKWHRGAFWPRLGLGGRSDWIGCGPSARLWHTALVRCIGSGYGTLRLAAGSVLMREIARCIRRHAPALVESTAADDFDMLWPPPPQPSLIGSGTSAADAFATAATAAACFRYYVDLCRYGDDDAGPPPGVSQAEWEAAERDVATTEASLSEEEKDEARRARYGAAAYVAQMAADEAAFPFEWEVERLQEAPPPPPRVPFDPQARIAGWEGTLLTRLLTSAVPARWAAQAEMAAVLVEELGCDPSAPIAAGAAPHAVPHAAGVPVDAALDYTLMHAAAAVWLAGLGGAPRANDSGWKPWSEPEWLALEQESQPTTVYQAPTPPPRVAAAALRYIVDRVPALGAALRVRRRGLPAIASDSFGHWAVSDLHPSTLPESSPAPHPRAGGSAGAAAAASMDTTCGHTQPASAPAPLPLVSPALQRLQMAASLEAAGLSPVEAALAATPYLRSGPSGLRLIPVVHEIVASGDRDAVEYYLGVDLPRLSAALLPVWESHSPGAAVSPVEVNVDEPAIAAAVAVTKQLGRIRSGQQQKEQQQRRGLPQQRSATVPSPEDIPTMLQRWLRLQT
jgi:hypothetical protein